jgi:hypothetical protein
VHLILLFEVERIDLIISSFISSKHINGILHTSLLLDFLFLLFFLGITACSSSCSSSSSAS